MFSQHQQGKGIFSFLAGSIVALIAVGTTLFMLNKNSTRDFKEPQLVSNNPSANQNNQIETLIPKHHTTSTPNIATSSDTMPSEGNTPNTNNGHAQKTENTPPPTALRPQTVITSNNTQEDLLGDDEPLPNNIITQKPTNHIHAAQPTKPRRPATTKHKKSPSLPTTADDIKPTAEQILNSGNIDKARAVARQEAHNKRFTEENKTSDNIHKLDTAKKTIQAGAFSSRDAADNQRAKLALKGVKTRIITAKSGNKTVYRVQTDAMDSEQASKISHELEKNGIKTFTK